MLRFINALYMARNQIWRLWVIWLISLDPASAVSLVNGTLGDSVYFHQFVYWNAPLEWRFGEFGDDTVVAVKPFYKAPYCYPEYQGRCELTNEGALRLNNLTYTDQGQYVFIVGANHPYANQIVYYRLQIFPSLSAPVLILKSSHGDLVSGSNVTFYCDSGHQNITTYTFYRDGKNICVESHVTCSGSSLSFQPITASDSGAYTCAIQNPVSTSTSNTLLVNVSAILTAPTLVPISTLRHPVNGTYVSLQCDAGKQDVTAYHFYHNKKNVCTRPHVTCRGSKLYFQPITASDGGSYICTIQNRVSNSTSNTLRLNVFVVQSAAPVLTSNITGWVWEGDTVSFHCTTETGLIEWHLDGDVLPKDGRYNLTGDEAKQNSTLIISPVFKNDTGVYTCVVDNNSSNAVNLSVAKSPDSSSISCGSSSSGDGLVLVCSWAGGDPAAEIELSFNGTADKGLDTVNRTVILGDDVQQPDFVCKGNQLGKTSECNITFERPQDTNHDNNAISTVTEGGDTTLKVSITNSLNSTFSWFRLNPEVNITNDNKNTIQSSGSESTLTIKSVTASENGTYECRARNIIGSTTFRFNVEVKTQESKGSGGLSGGAIAGIVIGVIAGVALIGVGGFFLVKKLK